VIRSLRYSDGLIMPRQRTAAVLISLMQKLIATTMAGVSAAAKGSGGQAYAVVMIVAIYNLVLIAALGAIDRDER
jgi:hypothetical protein